MDSNKIQNDCCLETLSRMACRQFSREEFPVVVCASSMMSISTPSDLPNTQVMLEGSQIDAFASKHYSLHVQPEILLGGGFSAELDLSSTADETLPSST